MPRRKRRAAADDETQEKGLAAQGDLESPYVEGQQDEIVEGGHYLQGDRIVDANGNPIDEEEDEPADEE